MLIYFQLKINIKQRSIIDVCPDFKMLADQLTHIELVNNCFLNIIFY